MCLARVISIFDLVKRAWNGGKNEGPEFGLIHSDTAKKETEEVLFASIWHVRRHFFVNINNYTTTTTTTTTEVIVVWCA